MEKESCAKSENRFDEHCAAVLIGLPLSDLRRLAQHGGLGHRVANGGSEQFVFTYPELLQLSLMAARGNA